jgi:hypothetical protein
MGQLSPTFSLRKLPPAPAHGALVSEPSFAYRGRRPVSAEFDSDGAFSSPCICFDDYSRMRTVVHKSCGERQLPTPSWAVNASELRALLVRFLETRAGIRKPGAGSLIQRLNEAHRRLLASIPRKIEVLDRLCVEFQSAKQTDPARARMLQSQIQNLDTSIRLIRLGPGTVARMVHLYYAVGYNSCGCASEIGCSPMLVRQTLYRLHRIANQRSTERIG